MIKANNLAYLGVSQVDKGLLVCVVCLLEVLRHEMAVTYRSRQ